MLTTLLMSERASSSWRLTLRQLPTRLHITRVGYFHTTSLTCRVRGQDNVRTSRVSASILTRVASPHSHLRSLTPSPMWLPGTRLVGVLLT